jgi:hypothetical protein
MEQLNEVLCRPIEFTKVVLKSLVAEFVLLAELHKSGVLFHRVELMPLNILVLQLQLLKLLLLVVELCLLLLVILLDALELLCKTELCLSGLLENFAGLCLLLRLSPLHLEAL